MPCFDAVGNVTCYINTNGEVLELISYSPFGDARNALKLQLFFYFSSKYIDHETSLSYYGYRYYNSNMGRWISRDPIGERGGLNLYVMVGNDVINKWDILGLFEIEWEGSWTETEKQAILSSFKQIKERNETLKKQIKDEISNLEKDLKNCPELLKDLKDKLDKLSGVLDSMIKNIDSKSRNLEIYKKNLGAGEIDAKAAAWVSPVAWYDDELHINDDINWMGNSDFLNDMMHEISHYSNTHDDVNGNDYTSAHQIEKLWDQNIDEWPVYGYDKKKALRDCCKEEGK